MSPLAFFALLILLALICFGWLMFCGWLIEKRKGTPPPQPYAPKPETVPQQHAPKSETSRPREFPIGDDESSDFGRQKDIARKIWRDQAPAEASREKQEWERQAEERIRHERVDAEQRLGNPGYSDDVVQRTTRQQQEEEEEDQERDKRRRRSRGR